MKVSISVVHELLSRERNKILSDFFFFIALGLSARKELLSLNQIHAILTKLAGQSDLGIQLSWCPKPVVLGMFSHA